MNDLKENYSQVLNKVKESLLEAGRKEGDCTLIAVSKTKPVEMIQTVYECGCRDFGENHVQEIVEKYDRLPHDIRWHMIGHLQTNKIKYIIDKVYMIHSVDTMHLAQAISREAVKRNLSVKVLLEINVAGEESKYGTTKDEALQFYREASALPGIEVCGLMTVAPYVEDSEENRQYFVDLYKLMVDINAENNDNKNVYVLSMGMTGDYEVAISEGSTYVRVGTGIFGERNKV